MRSFTYERPSSPAEAAVKSAAETPNAKFIAGGTNLLDLMKLEIETPAHLVDVNSLGGGRRGLGWRFRALESEGLHALPPATSAIASAMLE